MVKGQGEYEVDGQQQHPFHPMTLPVVAYQRQYADRGEHGDRRGSKERTRIVDMTRELDALLYAEFEDASSERRQVGNFLG